MLFLCSVFSVIVWFRKVLILFRPFSKVGTETGTISKAVSDWNMLQGADRIMQGAQLKCVLTSECFRFQAPYFLTRTLIFSADGGHAWAAPLLLFTPSSMHYQSPAPIWGFLHGTRSRPAKQQRPPARWKQQKNWGLLPFIIHRGLLAMGKLLFVGITAAYRALRNSPADILHSLLISHSKYLLLTNSLPNSRDFTRIEKYCRC